MCNIHDEDDRKTQHFKTEQKKQHELDKLFSRVKTSECQIKEEKKSHLHIVTDEVPDAIRSCLVKAAKATICTTADSENCAATSNKNSNTKNKKNEQTVLLHSVDKRLNNERQQKSRTGQSAHSLAANCGSWLKWLQPDSSTNREVIEWKSREDINSDDRKT